MIHCLEDHASLGELGFKLGFADATEPESIPKKILSLVFSGDDDLEAIVFHFATNIAPPDKTSSEIVSKNTTDYRDTISALEILDTATPIPFILTQFFFCYDSTPSAFAIKLFIAANIAGLASVFMFSSSERVVIVW